MSPTETIMEAVQTLFECDALHTKGLRQIIDTVIQNAEGLASARIEALERKLAEQDDRHRKELNKAFDQSQSILDRWQAAECRRAATPNAWASDEMERARERAMKKEYMILSVIDETAPAPLVHEVKSFLMREWQPAQTT